MPTKPPRVCGYCGGVHKAGEKCEKAKAHDKERKARFDKSRPNSSRRGYDRRWEEAARAFLARPENRYCAHCAAVGLVTPATVVMHKRSIRSAPHLRMEPSNWVPGCVRHNAIDAARERSKRRK